MLAWHHNLAGIKRIAFFLGDMLHAGPLNCPGLQQSERQNNNLTREPVELAVQKLVWFSII
jgi:hypothetical protein